MSEKNKQDDSKRKRKNQIIFRCSDEELELLNEVTQKSGLSRTDFFLSVLKNGSVIIINISEYEKNISSCISKTDIQMKEFNTKMEMHLNDFEQKKRQFFKFDNAKTFFFWASQAVSFGTFGFLVYFLFFRG